MDKSHLEAFSAKAVGERLIVTRNALGYTQAEMAAMCGLSGRSAWANYEKGYRVISRKAAYALCLRIGISTDWIYRGRLNDVARDLANKIQAEMRTHDCAVSPKRSARLSQPASVPRSQTK